MSSGRLSLAFLLNPPEVDARACITPFPLVAGGMSLDSTAIRWDSRRGDVRVATDHPQVATDHLLMDDSQRSALTALYQKEQYANVDITRRTFGPHAASQAGGMDFLLKHKLDLKAREQLESKWSVTWSTSWAVNGGADRVQRILLQW